MADATATSTSLADWRRDYEEGMRQDWGWLTVTGLYWIDDGSFRLGSAADAEIRMEPGEAGTDSEVPAVAARIVRNGHVVELEIVTPGSVLKDGIPAESHRLKFNGSQGERFVLGHQSFLVVQRGDRVGVRTWNNDSEQRKAYRGPDWFPADDAFRTIATFRKYDEPEVVEYLNVIGDRKSALVSGEWVFKLQGRELSLISLGDEDRPPFFVFRDGTSGQESYGASRFLQADMPEDGRVELDFNRAYNPPCAFTPHATCPLPPRHNILDLRITAGERLYQWP